VNFDLSPEEAALQEGIRRLCRGVAPLDRLRSLEGRVDRDLWRALGDAGVFSLRLPEPEGAGLGAAQAVLVFEELGRAVVPGPLIGSHLSAGLHDGAATGERLVGLVDRTTGPMVVDNVRDLDLLVAIDEEGLWAIDPPEVLARRIERPLDPLATPHVVESLPQGELWLGRTRPPGGGSKPRRLRRRCCWAWPRRSPTWRWRTRRSAASSTGPSARSRR